MNVAVYILDLEVDARYHRLVGEVLAGEDLGGGRGRSWEGEGGETGQRDGERERKRNRGRKGAENEEYLEEKKEKKNEK